MKLSSARELKAQMIEQASALTKQSFAKRGSITPNWYSRMMQGDNPTQPGTAFGIARMGPKSSDYGVAVRVLANLLGIPSPVPSLQSLTRYSKEVDIQTVSYTPRFVLQAGMSIGHPNITAGTLGGFVEDQDHYYILSNNHVIADSGQAEVGDPIWQPGPYDLNGKTPHVAAHLSKWAPLSTSNCDAAIAQLADDPTLDFYPWYYEGIGYIQHQPVSDRYQTVRVVKQGRTTKLTEGEVSAFDLDGITINYGTPWQPRPFTFNG